MPSLVNLLKDVDVQAISLVEEGANGQRIFLYKCDGWNCSLPELPSSRIVKAEPEGEDWSGFYIVVAEPGREEKPGLYGDQTTVDVWESEDEIRKAAWRFMRNGALVNKMHEDMAPFGQVVENAVAHADFQVGTETIRKGSWYVAIEPTEEGRRKIANGEFRGVSIQGSGTRVEKYNPAMITPDLERSPRENWVDRVGGFPKTNWIARAATHMNQKGMTMSRAIATAVNAAKKLCATGDVNFPGVQRADPRAQADACKAVAEWEAMKARSGVAKTKLPKGTELWKAEETEESVRAVLGDYLDTVEPMEKEGLLEKIARVVLGKDAAAGECDCGCAELEVDPDAPADAEVDLAKAKLTAAGRKQLPSSAFVYPAKAPGPGSYPIHDRAHAANALARSSGKPEAGAVKAAVCKRFSDLPACQSGAMAKGLSEDGGTVGTAMDLAERVEQIEKTVNGMGEKLDALTAEDSPLVKGIQDLKVRFEEKATEDEKAAKKSDEKTDEPSAAEIEKKLDDVAEGQETLAKALLDINEQVEKLADGSGSRQVDQVEPVAKSNAHPLSGLFG